MNRQLAQFQPRDFSGIRPTQPANSKNNNALTSLVIVATCVLCLALSGCLGVTGATNPPTKPASGPALSLSSNSLTFGSVVDSAAGHQVLTMSNTGSAAVSVTQLSFSTQAFNITGAYSMPITILPGQNASLNIQFAPTTAGAINGTLAITSNATPTTEMVALSGTGVADQAKLVLSPTSIPFGTVTVGGSAVQSVIMSNPGNIALSVSQISLSGAGFSITGPFSLPMTVFPNQVGQFNVKFAPSAAGAVSGTISITSNASSTPTLMAMTGTGSTSANQPQISVSPNPVAFGNVTDGTSATQRITVSNPGSVALSITQIAAAGTGFSVNGFTLPVNVAAGQSASFSAQFAPASAGSVNGSITINSNASPSTLTVPLSGTGTAPTQAQISVTPNPVPFGNVAVGGSSAQSMKISNTGSATLTITALSASGTGYSVSGYTLPISVAAGQSANFNAQFAPSASGSSNGSISLTSNTSPALTTVTMTGTGVLSGITATPSSATFTNVVVGSPNSQTIKLQNAGTASVTITQATPSGTGFSISGLTLPATLAGGASTTFNIVFSPTSAGNVTGSLVLTGNMSNSPLTIPLTGSAAAPTHVLNASTTSLTYPSVAVGSNSAQNVTLTNSGNSSVTISAVSAPGSGFVVSGLTAGQVVAAGQTATLTVTFTPTTASTASANVVVTSNATNSPLTVTLSGTGVTTVQHSVALSWTASTSSTVVGYRVYRSSTSGGPYTLITGSPVTATTFTDTTVLAGQTYFYVVTAVDSSGTESVNSNEVSATVPTP